MKTVTVTTSSTLKMLRANPESAKLPLFDRKGWKRLPFGTFAESVNDRVEPTNAAEEIYVGLDDLDSGNLHIRRWGKGSDVIGTKLRFRKGDVIFGRRRAYQRKLAVAEFDGICSAHAMVVRAKPDLVLPEFLPFLMMSDRFMKRAVEISVGSLSPTINWTTLKLVARLRRHLGNAKFTALGERLEKIKERHEQGFLSSLEFLKQILELAKEVVAAEKETDPEEERDRAKEALTELFTEARSSNTHFIVERVVADIDEIVKKVRFPDWQHTTQGERLVQKELRRTLLKYKLHTDQELFDRAYAYIKQYY